ncbi:glutamate N-acetyltransferase [Sorochytrium milnesiophthora]
MRPTLPLSLGAQAGARFPRGFRIGSAASGVKAKGALDLALLTSTLPCAAAGTFTRNAFAAAPVLISREMLQQNLPVNSVLINSGCANACTGPEGMYRATVLQREAERLIAGHCLLMSTGVIGQQLNVDKIKAALPGLSSQLSNTTEAFEDAARAIMTTDKFPKFGVHTLAPLADSTGDDSYSIAGIAKGAGMIHPDMAIAGPSNQGTMLSVAFTDANVTADVLRTALRDVVDSTFNAVSVDGDTSTNDTVLLLANGACNAGAVIDSTHTAEYAMFCDMLFALMAKLSDDIVRDGEGATKLVTIMVKGAPTKQIAKAVASNVATSPLVKTAFYGEDANWGRIVCAVGNTQLPEQYQIDPTNVHLHLATEGWHAKDASSAAQGQHRDRLHLVRQGTPYEIDEPRAKAIMEQSAFEVHIDLGMGSEQAWYKTCDMGHEYININADYRT